MKKYLKITTVLAVFGVLVFLKQVKGESGSMQVAIGNQNNSNNPTQDGRANGISYKDGNYTGSVQDAYYGNVQVQIAITNGKIINVTFLQHPGDNGTSRFINSQAMPMLTQEALQVQSAQVNIVSGASATSQAFQASLADALTQATK